MLRAYSKSEGTGKRRALRRPPFDHAQVSADYAELLLASLGHVGLDLPLGSDLHPALAAAASGLMALTGRADGPPVPAPGHLIACARGALAAVAALAAVDEREPPHSFAALDAATLLTERAAIFGLGRRGLVSAGGSCRLIRARDGWLAVNLPRPDDLATVPAWLERPTASDPWDTIADVAATRAAAPLVARARLLGLAVAAAAPAAGPTPWCRLGARGTTVTPAPGRPPLVVDLSSLWAGPLAAHLLQLAGARVLKVESTTRPDGARRGPATFFDLLHAGKESVALDFTSPTGRRALVGLVARADIVIESARPRAMQQLGIDPAMLVRARPGLTWVSITAYGRRGAAANWIGFGDDAAAAAGLATATGALAGSAPADARAGTDPTPLFCGDALADPLTGIHAAAAALGAHRRGGGALLSLALRDVAAHALAFGPPATPVTVARVAAGSEWDVAAAGERRRVLPPRSRLASGVARAFGADTDRLLRELDVG
jgi:crotonobetainyl-CoA:carnitine CoA-transferase CaiB-like acyl-CoA transferase